jgi:hypothetical protein
MAVPVPVTRITDEAARRTVFFDSPLVKAMFADTKPYSKRN